MSAPVGHTCPMIDTTIEAINSAIKEIDDAKDRLSDLVGRYDVIEKIRDANHQLRQWGEELEEELEAALDENKRLNDRIAALEAELVATDRKD